jgi:predicted nucleotidyltransferase
MRENPLTLDDLLGILGKWKADFAVTYGVTEIGIFGSYTRGEAKPDSDVDVVVKMEEPDFCFAPVHSVDDLTDTPQGMEKLDSICMLLVAIGESCKKINRLTDGKLLPRSRYPEIDWKGVKGLLDIISNHYFDVDAEVIYGICTKQVPILAETFRHMLEELD